MQKSTSASSTNHNNVSSCWGELKSGRIRHRGTRSAHKYARLNKTEDGIWKLKLVWDSAALGKRYESHSRSVRHDGGVSQVWRCKQLPLELRWCCAFHSFAWKWGILTPWSAGPAPGSLGCGWAVVSCWRNDPSSAWKGGSDGGAAFECVDGNRPKLAKGSLLDFFFWTTHGLHRLLVRIALIFFRVP